MFRRQKEPPHIRVLRKKTKQPTKLHKHPAFFVPVMTIGVLMTIVVSVLLILNRGNNPLPTLQSSDTKIALVRADDTELAVPTRAKTVGELLKKLDITVHEGDVVEPAIDTDIVSDNFRINVYRAKPVAIVDGDKTSYALSAATTPRSILSQAGTDVYPEDRLVLEPTDDFVTEGTIGQKITIDRSVPVNVNLYGTQLTMRTQAETIGDFLKEKNITLASGETVQPNIASPIKPDEPIFVNRKGVAIETKNEDVPFAVQYVDDKNLTFGVTATRQEGVPGKRIVTYQTNNETGERTEFHVITVQEPVPKIVARGTYINIPENKQSVMAAAGISPSDYSYVDFIVSRESGWNVGATNSSSGAYGLCQALPGTKMATAGSDWRTNAVTQLRWCSGYATQRYGSWGGAYNFWINNKWW